MNPYVLIATHQRMSITRDNVKCLLACNAGVILVVSDAGEEAVFRQLFPSIEIVLYPNQPLGAKWQSGVERAREINADPLIINGSDDILHSDFFVLVANAMKSDGVHFIGLKSWYVYDTRKIYKFNYLANLPLGGGRAYSKELLQKINYSLFDISRSRHLDDLAYGNVLNSKMKIKIFGEPLILSIKGDWPVMNPMQKLFNTQNAALLDTLDPKEILKQFKYLCAG